MLQMDCVRNRVHRENPEALGRFFQPTEANIPDAFGGEFGHKRTTPSTEQSLWIFFKKKSILKTSPMY